MSEADAEDGLQGLDAYHTGMNEGTTLDFAFHSDRFLFPYRKPAPPFCHPIPIQPPREKNITGYNVSSSLGRCVKASFPTRSSLDEIRMEKGQKARAEHRGYSRGVGRNEYVESSHNPSVRISPKPPRTRSVRSQSVSGFCSKCVRISSYRGTQGKPTIWLQCRIRKSSPIFPSLPKTDEEMGNLYCSCKERNSYLNVLTNRVWGYILIA